MKTHSRLIAVLMIAFIKFHDASAQFYALGEISVLAAYSFPDDKFNNIFSGISIESGFQGDNGTFQLRTSFFGPKNTQTEMYMEDQSGYTTETLVDEKTILLEFGLYGRYYIAGDWSTAVRFFTNSGIDYGLEHAHQEYELNTIPFVDSFWNKNLRVALGLGLDVSVTDELSIISDNLFKYPLSDFYGGHSAMDVMAEVGLYFSLGVRFTPE